MASTQCTVCGQPRWGSQSKCRDCYNEYMAAYMLARYRERRREAIELLGGRCVQCGSTVDLEFDHIDRATKSGDVSRWLCRGRQRYLDELKKCQLLCFLCHRKKSGAERSVEHGGGLSGKRNCPCPACVSAKKAYMASYVRRRKH